MRNLIFPAAVLALLAMIAGMRAYVSAVTLRHMAVFFAALTLLAAPSHAGEDGQHGSAHPALKKIEWAFDGPFGTLDKTAAQRGYQIYKEVCSACHSMNLVAYRSLAEIGFPEPEIKALAAEKQVKDGPGDDGEMFERAARPSDHFVPPYMNEQAARASNGGAYPPDLSLIVKSRPDGANYVYSLLTGYQNAKYYTCSEAWPQGDCKTYAETDEGAFKTERARVAQLKADRAEVEKRFKAQAAKTKPANDAEGKPLPPAPLPELTAAETTAMKPTVLHCMHIGHEKIPELFEGKETGRDLETQKCAELADGKYYNPIFPGGQISMTPPLSDDRVSYGDGTKATLDQETRDVVTFLQWAAEPEMEQRKSMGVKTILFLILMTGFLYAAKRRVWRNVAPVSKDDFVA